LYPVPVPISITRIPGSASSAASICDTTAGIDADELTWRHTKSGMNTWRGTSLNAARHRWSSSLRSARPATMR
jgi:hypothetical protein